MESTVSLTLDKYEKLKADAKRTHVLYLNIAIDRYRDYPEFISNLNSIGYNFSEYYNRAFIINGEDGETGIKSQVETYLNSLGYEQGNQEQISGCEMTDKLTKSYITHLERERVELAVQLDRIPNWIKKIFK